MNIQELNSIFQSKYPEGSIIQRGKLNGNKSKTAVTFTSNGKVYEYSNKSYADLLTQLGFKVIYKKDAERIQQRINELEAEIAAGGCEDIFSEEFTPYTEKELSNLNHELEHQKAKLTYTII